MWRLIYFTVRLGIYDQIFHWGFDTKINSHLISVIVWFISYGVSMTPYITSYIAVQVLEFKKTITKFFFVCALDHSNCLHFRKTLRLKH